MKVRHAGQREEKVELMMTPMIDIVFQLLIFFIMTFKIIAPEGDFNIKMPLAAPSQGLPEPDQLPPMTVRLSAKSNGEIAGIQLNQQVVQNFPDLRNKIRGVLGDDAGPGSFENTEVEIDADYDLRYEYVVEAITAVTGYVDPDTGLVKKLVEKIKFAPPDR